MFNVNIQLLDNCLLRANDTTLYTAGKFTKDNIGEYQFLEYVVLKSYLGEKRVSEGSLQSTHVTAPAETFSANFDYNYTLRVDGSHTYIKVALPIYVNQIEDGLYWKDEAVVELKGGVFLPLNLIDLEGRFFDTTEYYTVTFFSLCKLGSCLLALQKATLPMYVDCDDNLDELRYKRDFISAMNYVLHYYVHVGKEEEAQRLLERMQICDSICSSVSAEWSKQMSCNCG